VTLFRERAAVAEPIDAVHEICRRLDGLPLAVELAAARTRLLPPDQLLERLDRSLPILTGGRRDAPERQRTLRATIAWSYDLLDDEEKQLFGRLAVFAGSFTVEAAEQVCDADLETLESLLDNSLLRRWASGRLGMLETIREYATELLEESGEGEAVRGRHEDWALALAESANAYYNDAAGAYDYELVLREAANLRAAAESALRSDPELALRLVVALEMFWVLTGPREGARQISKVLEAAREAPAELRAHGFRVLGSSLNPAGDQEGAEVAYRQSVELFEQVGDEREAAVSTFRLGATASNMQDPARARPLLEESLERLRAAGDTRVELQVVGVLGTVAAQEGDLVEARKLLRESANRAAEIGFTWWQSVMLSGLVEADLDAGVFDEAGRHARQMLELARRMGERQLTVCGLAYLARAAAEVEDRARASILWGAIEAEESRGTIGAWESERDALRAQLGKLADAAVDEGRALTLENAVEYALADA